VLNHTAW